MSDLSAECPEGMYTCHMGACVPMEGVCDGIQTCPDNSDENFRANCDSGDGGGGNKPILDPTAAPVPAGLIAGSVICAILFLIVIALIIANLVIRNRRQTKRKRNERLLTVKDHERRNKTALFGASDPNRSHDSSEVGTANPGFTMPDSLRPSYEDLGGYRRNGTITATSAPVKVNPYDNTKVKYIPSKGPAYQPKNKEDYDKPNPYMESSRGPPSYNSQEEIALRPDTLRHPNWDPNRGYQHGGPACPPYSYQGQQQTPPSRRSDDAPLQRKSLTGSGSLLPYLSLTGVGAQDHPDFEFVQAMSNGHTSSFEGSTSDFGHVPGGIHSEV